MSVYAPTLLSLSIAVSLVLLGALSFIKFERDPTLVAHSAKDHAIRFSMGIIAILLLIINLNLWLAGHWIYIGMFVLGCAGLGRLWNGRRHGGARVAGWIVCFLVLAIVVGCLTAYRVDAAHHWLIETSNHDTLFYFEGAHWATRNAVFVDPSVVEGALHLGSCRQGAVYIGNDCPVYRGGSFSLLGYALGFGAGDGANDMLLASSLAVLLLGAGLLPLLVQYQAPTRLARLAWVPFGTFLALIVTISPTLLAAAINSNIATIFGTAAVGMVLALSLHADAVWWRRPLMTGLGAALAAHTYGEAAAPSVIFAAMGVLFVAVNERSVYSFIRSAAVCAGGFFISANVVVLELLQSASDVAAIASGGQWEGYYLNANPITWIAAPFAGMVVNGDPYVSHEMLLLGGALSAIVVLCSLADRRAFGALVCLVLVATLLITFVEARQYVYGEHKVVQMVGTSACMLAVGVVIRFLGISPGEADVREIWSRRAAAVLILLLMLGAIRAQARPSLKVIKGWQALHGLSLDFRRDLEVAEPEVDWVIDDTGTSSVERYQKTHYVAYIIHASGGRSHLPKLDIDGMRGGYARQVLGDTLSGVTTPRWLVQLKSHDGIESPFRYPGVVVKHSTEYDLLDLTKAPPALAVSGAGWLACGVAGCPVTSGFEIETLSWAADAKPCRLMLSIAPVDSSSSDSAWMTIEGHDKQLLQLTSEGTYVSIPRGWQRIRFEDVNGAEGVRWVLHAGTISCGSASAGPVGPDASPANSE